MPTEVQIDGADVLTNGRPTYAGREHNGRRIEGLLFNSRMDWKARRREDRVEDLSGYQTLPVNWSINTPVKRAFFDRLREITGGA